MLARNATPLPEQSTARIVIGLALCVAWALLAIGVGVYAVRAALPGHENVVGWFAALWFGLAALWLWPTTQALRELRRRFPGEPHAR